MKISREMKKEEAIKRMQKMGIYNETIEHFAEHNIVSMSEPVRMLGTTIGGLYWLNDDQKRIVKNFEEEYNALVYLVVRSHTNIGIMDCLFYVSDHKVEWVADNADLDEKYTCAYVVNYDIPEYSEFGMIAWEEASGGIIRKF